MRYLGVPYRFRFHIQPSVSVVGCVFVYKYLYSKRAKSLWIQCEMSSDHHLDQIIGRSINSLAVRYILNKKMRVFFDLQHEVCNCIHEQSNNFVEKPGLFNVLYLDHTNGEIEFPEYVASTSFPSDHVTILNLSFYPGCIPHANQLQQHTLYTHLSDPRFCCLGPTGISSVPASGLHMFGFRHVINHWRPNNSRQTRVRHIPWGECRQHVRVDCIAVAVRSIHTRDATRLYQWQQ